MRALFLLLFLLCAVSAVHAQTAAPRESGRRVTVHMKKGEAVSGTFLRADSQKVFLEVDGDQTTVRLDDVNSLVFTEAEPDAPALKAIKALKSLAESAARARNQREYGNRLLEVKAVVEDQLPLIPEGDLREAISDALKAYELVNEIWEQAARTVPQEESAKMTKDAVATTLGSARKRLEDAEELLKRP